MSEVEFKILIVDDDTSFYDRFVEKLPAQCITVFANSPEVAKYKIMKDFYHVFLIDLVYYKNKQEGFNLINEIKTIAPHAKVIVVSHDRSDHTIIEAFRSKNIDHYLPKYRYDIEEWKQAIYETFYSAIQPYNRKTVFLSYLLEDYPLAVPVGRSLANSQYHVLTPYISSTEKNWELLCTNIKSADIFLPVFTPDSFSNNSSVMQQANFANGSFNSQYNKSIIPILKDIEPHDAVFLASNNTYIDLTEAVNALEEKYETLKGHISLFA
jgi:ActR/RegA family two-component response regulator